MQDVPKLKITTPETKETWIPCGTCNLKTCHHVLSDIEAHYTSDCGHVDAWTNYLTVQCQGCKTVSYCIESSCSEDYDHDNDGHAYLNISKKFFPSRIAGRSMMNEAHYLPHGVYKIYEEAHTALCNELGVMTGFGIRAIVEAVCLDQGTAGSDLKKKINNLTGTGLITSAGAAILHNLRFMGNNAVHEMKSHSDKEVNAAFDVVEYLLKGVYVLPKQAEELPNQNS